MDTSEAGPAATGDDTSSAPDERPVDPDAPIRGRIRGRDERRLCHGTGLRVVPGLTAEQERLRDLKAYLAVAPDSAVFTSLTGAELMGWALPPMPVPAPVFIATDLTDLRPRRQGLVCRRVTRIRQRHEREGLPVDEPEEILLAASRDVGPLDLLILLESALNRGDVDERRMAAILESRRPGVRNLRWARLRATTKAESAGETILYELHRCLEVAFEPQAEIFDGDGRFLGRADLRIRGTKLLQEYDGHHHRKKEQQRTDLRRARGLAGSGHERRGYTLDDLLNHTLVVMHEIDRALGRAHDRRRLEAWRELVEHSLYSDTGRARIMHRWRRAGGPGGPVRPDAA